MRQTVARHIALLRGINIGSNRRVSMPELRELLGDRGYQDVRTLLQSGNVVLTAEGSSEKLRRELEKAIADGLGLELDVVVRTPDELADAIARNPLPEAVREPKHFQVSFLSGEPDAEVAAVIEGRAVAPEQVAFSGREVYAFYANGMQKSALARLLTDKRLGVTATARNWNTVTKLLELADG